MKVMTKDRKVTAVAVGALMVLLFTFSMSPLAADAVEADDQSSTAEAIEVAEAAGAQYGTDGLRLSSVDTTDVLSVENMSPYGLMGTSLASSEDMTSDGWSYQVSPTESSVTLTGYSGTSLAPIVPATVEGLPVTGAIVNAGSGAPSITSVDLSAVKGTLASLKVYGCSLTSLDLSDCAQLTYVDVRSNRLMSLTLGSNAQLMTLFCSENKLSAIDLSKCVALVKLDCGNNNLASLDVSKCSLLEHLDCHENYLTALSVGGNLELTDLFCYNNYIGNDLYALTQRYGSDQNVVLPQLSHHAASWKRLWGASALDTMDSIVKEGFTDTGGTVVVTTFDGYWDALSAAGLAGLVEAPVLMTDGSNLSTQTRERIVQLAPSKVVICGGVMAVSEQVSAQIKSLTNATIVRCAGAGATSTACEIFKKGEAVTGGSWSDTAVVATNDGYWDALSIAPYAYAMHAPIFLSEGAATLSDETLDTMAQGGIKQVYLVGGAEAVSDNVRVQLEARGIEVADRLWGANAIETSAAIATFEKSRGMGTDKLGIATSNGYWDALAGAALCGKNNSVILLVSDAKSSTIGGFVTNNASSISSGYVFGGAAAVSDQVLGALEVVTE